MAEHRWDTSSSTASADPGDPGDPGSSADSGVPVPGRRRWLLSFRAAVLAVCLLIGTAAAFAVLRGGDPVEVSSVELDAAESSPGAEGAATEHLGSDPSGAEQPGTAARPGSEHPGTAERSDSEQPGTEQPASAPTVLVVHVAGAVLQPGVVRVPEGSRTVDAVDAAGGAASDADLTAVNLAAALQDGSMVVVPRMGDPPRALPDGSALPGTGTGAGPGSSIGGPPGLVNLNTASVQELDTLPRVGPVIAERIVAWREEHGAFSRPEDLDAVPGIGEAMLATLLSLVTV